MFIFVSCLFLVHASIILTKQYSNIGAINILHMGFRDIYANHEVIFINLQGGLMNDKMLCVITSEDLGIVFSCGFTSIIKWAG